MTKRKYTDRPAGGDKTQKPKGGCPFRQGSEEREQGGGPKEEPHGAGEDKTTSRLTVACNQGQWSPGGKKKKGTTT